MGSPPAAQCDLHAHTTASDGLLSPLDLVAMANEKGLRAVGIADHDTVSGLRSLCELPGQSELVFGRVEVVPGVELNSEWRGREVHILGYFIPLYEGPLHELLAKLQESRRERISATIERLRALGMPLDEARVFELAGGESVGRPHIAEAMRERGYVTSVKEAFDRFLGIGRPGYVERFHLDPMQSVMAVREAGGVPVWAHPGTSQSLWLITPLVESGLLGIEAYHPEHRPNMRRKCVAMAEAHGLIVTGGSDFHGPAAGEGGDLGSVVVPYDVVSRLKEAAGL